MSEELAGLIARIGELDTLTLEPEELEPEPTRRAHE